MKGRRQERQADVYSCHWHLLHVYEHTIEKKWGKKYFRSKCTSQAREKEKEEEEEEIETKGKNMEEDGRTDKEESQKVNGVLEIPIHIASSTF